MKKALIIGLGITVAAAVVIIVVAILLKTEGDELSSFAKSYYTSCSNPKKTSALGRYSSAAISSDANPCATIAKNILRRDGTAADAAVAAMFCVGVKNAQSSGLGGGFLATYYSKAERKVYTLDAREVAPRAAYANMFNPDKNTKLKDKTGKWWEEKPSASLKGGLAVAVPGEAIGLRALYDKFGGRIPWRDLIQPTINICQEGYNLTWYTGGITQLSGKDLLREPSMSLFVHKEENRPLHEGELVQRLQLAETLRILQDDPMALQTGDLSRQLVEDIKSFGGIVTEADMRDYRPKWRQSVLFNLTNGNFSLHSSPPPGSGLLVGLIVNILDEYNLTAQSLLPDQIDRTQQVFAEAMKYAFGRRYQLGDLTDAEAKMVIDEVTTDQLASAFKQKIQHKTTNQDPFFYGAKTVGPNDHGTAHFSLISPNGDAVAITSSINYGYGAGIRSRQTGIILNNEMDDFSKPDSSSNEGSISMNKNLIKPGNRPLSSMSPTIVLDSRGDVRLVIGAAGGTQIPTAIAWVIARYLWMGQDLREAVNSCRSHHQLQPMLLQYEMGFPENMLKELESKGHITKEMRWKSVVIAAGRDANGDLVSNADFRKSGQIDGFY